MRPLALRACVFVAVSFPGIWVFADAPAFSPPADGDLKTHFASSSKAIFLGHNATPSSYALSAGQITAGNFGIAAGITEQITVATSP